MTVLYIDADACPVKDEALKVAERHGLQVYVVSNGGIRPSPHPLVETVIVPDGPDVADMWIAERVGPEDLSPREQRVLIPRRGRVRQPVGRRARGQGHVEGP